jgi:hypothetical protein
MAKGGGAGGGSVKGSKRREKKKKRTLGNTIGRREEATATVDAMPPSRWGEERKLRPRNEIKMNEDSAENYLHITFNSNGKLSPSPSLL